jgi:hypothetical protein
MIEFGEEFEELWSILLSRNPERIWRAYAALVGIQQNAVLEHLERIVHETGWQPEQRRSAQTALDAIANLKEKK